MAHTVVLLSVTAKFEQGADAESIVIHRTTPVYVPGLSAPTGSQREVAATFEGPGAWDAALDYLRGHYGGR